MKWLFLVHQLQTPNSRERVKVWRLTKKAGAVLYRNSVYVLPYSKERLEDFQWLCQQIKDSKGEASVFVSESHDQKEDGTLRELFKSTREEEYAAVLSSAERLLGRINGVKTRQQPSRSLLKNLSKAAKQINRSFADIQRVDFFGAPSSKKVSRTLQELEAHLAGFKLQPETPITLKQYARKAFQGKVWATREHIHIDRLGSAWLIRRFIDKKAKFVFTPESKLPKNAIPFDVFGAEFSHHGDDCTFETLLKSFQLQDKALANIAEIVHDVDVKDEKFNRGEAAGLDAVVRGLSQSQRDDHKMLGAGSMLLDAIYAHFSNKKERGKK
jgi:hypothetical protein